MRETDIRSVVLFFYLMFVDEKQVREMSHAVLSRFRNHLLEKKITHDDHYLVRAIHSQYKKRKADIFAPVNLESSHLLKLPKDLDLGVWLEFRKQATADELTSVIWTTVLGYPREFISEALGVSEGTARYRLSHGLRKLGRVSGLRVV